MSEREIKYMTEEEQATWGDNWVQDDAIKIPPYCPHCGEDEGELIAEFRHITYARVVSVNGQSTFEFHDEVEPSYSIRNLYEVQCNECDFTIKGPAICDLENEAKVFLANK